MARKPPIERFMRYVSPEPNSGCWLWDGPVANKHGYGSIYMKAASGMRTSYAHRAAWMLFVGEIPERTEVCHKCDNPNCCNPEHLFLGSHRDNMLDAAAKGKFNWKPGEVRNLRRGETHYQAKLTEDAVREIRSSPLTGRQLAQKFGVSPMAVSRAKRGECWRAVS